MKAKTPPKVQSAFMRMDVNGDGTLTKREMLAAEEFTPEEVNYDDIYIGQQLSFFIFGNNDNNNFVQSKVVILM